MSKQVRTVPVTVRALIQRINRKLAKDEEKLMKLRGERGRDDLGDYYVVNLDRNHVVNSHIDPEQFGRKIGVLEEWETVVQD